MIIINIYWGIIHVACTVCPELRHLCFVETEQPKKGIYLVTPIETPDQDCMDFDLKIWKTLFFLSEIKNLHSMSNKYYSDTDGYNYYNYFNMHSYNNILKM